MFPGGSKLWGSQDQARNQKQRFFCDKKNWGSATKFEKSDQVFGNFNRGPGSRFSGLLLQAHTIRGRFDFA